MSDNPPSPLDHIDPELLNKHAAETLFDAIMDILRREGFWPAEASPKSLEAETEIFDEIASWANS